jgi:RNA polymerase sigma factor (sigma-70 family)
MAAGEDDRDGDREADEARLVARIPTDEAAFEAIYRRHVRRITAYAARRCTTPEDVADVVAQTFVRLLHRAGTFDPARGTVSSFLHALAASEVADLHRAGARRRRLADRVAGRALLGDDDHTRLEQALDARRTLAGLRPALADLAPGEDAVLRLVADGLSAADAGRSLDITPDAARARLARARRRVRDHPSRPPGAEAPRPTEADPARSQEVP